MTLVPAAPRPAAYFDLDKTMIATSTTAALSDPIRRSGLISTTAWARGIIIQLPYLLSGADQEQTSHLMERMALASTGIEQRRLTEVVTEALDTAITPAVYAEALDLVAAHHRAGHEVVIVSASPREMVEPVAYLIGADRAIATRLEVDRAGRFTGRIAHAMLHEAKAQALHQDAEEHGIDLTRSWAYSDSVSDLPMLEQVGHPVAVNPDRDLRRTSQDRGWLVKDFDRPVALRRSLRPHAPSWSVPSVLGAGLGLAAVAASTAYLVSRRR